MKAMVWIFAGGALGLALLACGDSAKTTGSGGHGGEGGSILTITTGTGGDVSGTGGKAPEGCGATVTGVVRDFHAGGDFQCTNSGYVDMTGKECGPWDPAIVGPLGALIGPQRKPVYAPAGKTASSLGKDSFDRWFSDVPGVNESAPLDVVLVAGASGTFSYDTAFFFPIDDKLFAAAPGDPDKGPFKSDDQKVRNFHFTYELHTTFRYDPGNVFTFRGDDDVFVYINDRLAVNLGGIHVPIQAKLALDTGRVEITVDDQWTELVKLHPEPALGLPETIPGGVAGTVDLGLSPGGVYAFDFFFAERNCCASNFRVETNFVFIDCGVVPTK
ncbi:MAG: fibro-slime domain-containing protein [Byssovorax sp.]